MSSTPELTPLQELTAAVEAITGSSADRAGAPDTGRTAVISTYGAASVLGDDGNLLDVPKVQIDVYVTDPADDLPERIMELLQERRFPYSVEDLNSYDPETNRLRTILQTEVF